MAASGHKIMEKSLQGKRIAILATHGFEQAELLEPRKALEAEGAETQVISPEKGRIKRVE
jgi:protease I